MRSPTQVSPLPIALDFQNHWADTPDALDLAAHFATQAIEKGPNEPYVHCVAAIIAFWQRDLEAAKATAEEAADREPELRPCLRDAQLDRALFGESTGSDPAH